jgi:hypothetical protein
VMASALTITHHRHRRLRPGGFRSARFRRVAGDPPMSAEVEVTFTFRVGNASPHDDHLLADIVAVDADIVERQQRRRRAQRRLHLGANVCVAMVQGGYLQSYARTPPPWGNDTATSDARPNSDGMPDTGRQRELSPYPAKRGKSRYGTSPRHNRRALGLPRRGQAPKAQPQELVASFLPPLESRADKRRKPRPTTGVLGRG